MSWLEQLKNADTVSEHATKPTERVSVAFVAPPPTVSAKNTGDVYGRLLALADTYGFDRALANRIPTADLPLYADMSGEYLIALLDALQDDADIDAGRVPRGWTAKAVCAHCGPVWLHPAVARLLTVRDGWPHAPLGCPWCRVRRRGKYLPRPPDAQA